MQQKAGNWQRPSPRSHTSFTTLQSVLVKHGLCTWGQLWLTNGIALPSPAALAKARAVQHVPLIVTLVERLVHIIGDTIHDALICLRKSRDVLSATALSSKTKSFCLARISLLLISLQRVTLTSFIHAKRSPSGICDHGRLVLHTPHCSWVHLSAACKQVPLAEKKVHRIQSKAESITHYETALQQITRVKECKASHSFTTISWGSLDWNTLLSTVWNH